MRVTATPRSVCVREPCTVRLELESETELTPGDTVEFQFPHSWCAQGDGPFGTRAFQTTDPDCDHYVSVATPEATFDIEISERQLPDPGTNTRHGRHVVATVRDGSVLPTSNRRFAGSPEGRS